MNLSIINMRIDHLNEITGSPKAYRLDDGTIAIGHYTLSQSYGGYELHRVVNTGGGVTAVSNDGHGTKKQLGAFLSAFISGIEYSQH